MKTSINFAAIKPIRLSKPYRFIFLLFFFALRISAQSITNNGDTLYISNGAILYINGTFKNLDNGTKHAYIRNEGTLQITGDLIKSSNLTYFGNDTLLLAGSSTQNIAGLPYWYLAVTGGGVTTFGGDATISKSLSLSHGTINTGSHTIFLDSQATILEDASDYVTGKVSMTKYLAKGTNYTFGGLGLEINADSLAPGMTSILRTTGSHLSGNGTNSINRYFSISPTNNGNTYSTLLFHYFDGELNSLSESDLAMYRKRGNRWEYDSFTLRNSTLNTLTTLVDSLSTFTLSGIIHPLPVELMSFEASLLNEEASLLQWTTASELNNDHFDVERSLNAVDFQKIGEIKGKGTVYTQSDYEYIDRFGAINSNILYYRLKQVDFNGKFTYSEIRKLVLSQKHQYFKAWYNSANQKLETIIYKTNETESSLRLIDAQGKLLAEQNVLLAKGETRLQLDMEGLAQGMYLLYVSDGEGLEVKKIVKY